VFRYLAAAALLLHLLWILWVIAGALFTRGRPLLTIFHIASLIWGVIVEAGPWSCPLTLAEQFCETRAGVDPYRGGFLLHYLDATVYPDIPALWLVCSGIAVCVANLAVYLWRTRKWYGKRRSR